MVETYGDRLAAAMKAAGMKTADLARELGLSYQAVRKVLLGGKFGTDANAAAARVLGVSSDWLATGRAQEQWPSPDMKEEVLLLRDDERIRLDNIVRAFLGLPQQRVQLISDRTRRADYADSGVDDDPDAIPPKQRKHGTQQNQRSARGKGGRSAP